MKEKKYEYMLHIWGGFFNEHNVEIHKEQPWNYKWFDSKEDRQLEIDRLNKLKDSCKTPDSCLVIVKEEGYLTRYKVIIKSIVEYKGRLYNITNDLGYGFYNSEIDELGEVFSYIKEWKWDIDIYNQIPGLDDADKEVKRLFTTVVIE